MAHSIEDVTVKSIIRCPLSVSETGLLKIVGDQRCCRPNVNQPGQAAWDYIACEYDPHRPNESNMRFRLTAREIEEWNL